MHQDHTIVTLMKLQARVNTLILGGALDPEEINHFYRKMLGCSKEIVRSQKWFEMDGVIYSHLKEGNTTVAQMIAHLESDGEILDLQTRIVLDRCEFDKNASCNIAILRGSLFENKDRFIRKVRALGERRHCSILPSGRSLSIRHHFTKEEFAIMGLSSIVVMHEPIMDINNELVVLVIRGHDLKVIPYSESAKEIWREDAGFAFHITEAQYWAKLQEKTNRHRVDIEFRNL